MFDEFGNYRKRIMVNYSHYFDCESESPLDDLINQCVEYAHDTNIPIPTSSYYAFAHDMQTNDESQLIPYQRLSPSKYLTTYNCVLFLAGSNHKILRKPSSSQRNMHVFQLELY
jgi:hypothetical protein